MIEDENVENIKEFENFENLPEATTLNLPSTPKQRMLLESIIAREKSYKRYENVMMECSKIVGRTIRGIGMLSRREIGKCLKGIR